MKRKEPGDSRYDALLGRLRKWAGSGALVAFSGGVDSGFLLFAAREALGGASAEKLLAVTLAAPYTPAGDVTGAETLAASLNVPHRVLRCPMPEEVRDNPPDRCYLCKRALFGQLLRMAEEEHLAAVLDGSNADDLSDFRPGMRALRELGVRSPLLEAGLGKAEIRELSRRFGLPTWNRPAGACLLTRLPHGVSVSAETLARIDRAEQRLREMGFPMVRVRCHPSGPGGYAEMDTARIELPAADLPRAVEPGPRERLSAALRELGFRHIALDLAGYRMGSFNQQAEA